MTDDPRLIDALKQRDQNALAVVFERYADKIYRLASSLLQDEQQADCVVQDTFLALIEHIDTFEARASIGTWLYRIAYNTAQGRLRVNRPNMGMEELEEGDIMPNALIDWQRVPDQIISSDEAQVEMMQAINRLSPALRDVFLLRDVEELSTQETAHILNISEGAVKVRLHRARLLLREFLATYFEEYAQR
jgi:RNA polymerase sigma-70 factor, ECF subfamily